MLNNNKTYANENLRDVQKVFNDGVCQIYKARERTITTLKGMFHFAKESVGVSQFWEAHNNNIDISASISIPDSSIEISNQDVCVIGEETYRIVRLQYHDNRKPNYWTLTLQRSTFKYEIESNGV